VCTDCPVFIKQSKWEVSEGFDVHGRCLDKELGGRRNVDGP
jgi:hypothetical protein